MANANNREIKKGTKLYTAFDEYLIIRQIGQGGNGTVYEVNNSSGEELAMKIVEINKLPSQKRKRFKNEIFFCQQKNHKNIIRIIDSGRDPSGKYAFYVMPLFAETLRSRMKQGINPTEAIELTVSLLEGLGFAHSKEIYHRDIKPENILLKKDSNECVIADFGIAHFPIIESVTDIKTKVGDRMANYQYAAPEQRSAGNTVDGRADIFAVGLILHEMLTAEIIIGSDYKKIANIYPSYAFLDDVVESLHKQNPKDRLFPAERVIEEINMRIQLADLEQTMEDKKRQFDRIKETMDAPEPAKSPTIMSANVESGELIFKLDRSVPKEWFEIFRSESYSHTSVMGYGPSRFQMKNDRELSVRIHGNETNSTLKSIVDFLKQWLPTVTQYYNAEVSRAYKREKRREMEILKKNIEELKRSQEMTEIVNSLI